MSTPVKFSYPPIQFSDTEMEFLRTLMRELSTVPMHFARDASNCWDKIVECPALVPDVPPDAPG